MTENKIEAWKKTGFTNLSREELVEAAEALGVDVPKGIRSERLAADLREATGYVETTLSAEERKEVRAQSAPDAKGERAVPNLGPTGRWGGRWRRVTLNRPKEMEDYVAFPLGWEGSAQKYYHFGVEVDMPWPHYQALKNMKNVRIVKKENEPAREIVTPRIPFSDHGDTPGTSHLPCDMREFVQGIAERDDNFKGYDKAKLIRVARLLHGPIAHTRYRDWEVDALRDNLLTFLGVDIYADDKMAIGAI